MGGTFDPIHSGHLLIAERAREMFDLKKVLFIPCGIPAHKKSYAVSDSHHRWNMTRMAVESNQAFEASRLEIDRPGVSFAVDTILSLRAKYPDEAPYFITGIDAILEILTWCRAVELPRLTDFIAAMRPGYDSKDVARILPEYFVNKIHFLDAPLVDISSTIIREYVRQGKSIRYMAPDDVVEYIAVQNLYKGD